MLKDNKLRGAYGETDLDTGLIRINVKKHSDKRYARRSPTTNGHEDLAKTIRHELTHWNNPNMSEKEVSKHDKKSLSKSERRKLLAKLKK